MMKKKKILSERSARFLLPKVNDSDDGKLTVKKWRGPLSLLGTSHHGGLWCIAVILKQSRSVNLCSIRQPPLFDKHMNNPPSEWVFLCGISFCQNKHPCFVVWSETRMAWFRVERARDRKARNEGNPIGASSSCLQSYCTSVTFDGYEAIFTSFDSCLFTSRSKLLEIFKHAPLDLWLLDLHHRSMSLIKVQPIPVQIRSEDRFLGAIGDGRCWLNCDFSSVLECFFLD